MVRDINFNCTIRLQVFSSHSMIFQNFIWLISSQFCFQKFEPEFFLVQSSMSTINSRWAIRQQMSQTMLALYSSAFYSILFNQLHAKIAVTKIYL